MLMAAPSRLEDVGRSCLGSHPGQEDEHRDARAAFLATGRGRGCETMNTREGAGSAVN